jgi:hypothetical protein
MIYRKGDRKMFTDFRLTKVLSFDDIFDGRLERFGVHDISVEGATSEFHCLTDGNNVLWVEVDDEIYFLLGFGMFNAAENILTAIGEVFDVEIFSEHQHQYWRNETEAECRCGRRKIAEEVQTRLNILIMRYVREGFRFSEPCSSFEPLVNIAKDLIIENPDLASPDLEEELLEKTNKIYSEKYDAKPRAIKQELRIAAHLGHFLH